MEYEHESAQLVNCTDEDVTIFNLRSNTITTYKPSGLKAKVKEEFKYHRNIDGMTVRTCTLTSILVAKLGNDAILEGKTAASSKANVFYIVDRDFMMVNQYPHILLPTDPIYDKDGNILGYSAFVTSIEITPENK